MWERGQVYPHISHSSCPAINCALNPDEPCSPPHPTTRLSSMFILLHNSSAPKNNFSVPSVALEILYLLLLRGSFSIVPYPASQANCCRVKRLVHDVHRLGVTRGTLNFWALCTYSRKWVSGTGSESEEVSPQTEPKVCILPNSAFLFTRSSANSDSKHFKHHLNSIVFYRNDCKSLWNVIENIFSSDFFKPTFK